MTDNKKNEHDLLLARGVPMPDYYPYPKPAEGAFPTAKELEGALGRLRALGQKALYDPEARRQFKEAHIMRLRSTYEMYVDMASKEPLVTERQGHLATAQFYKGQLDQMEKMMTNNDLTTESQRQLDENHIEFLQGRVQDLLRGPDGPELSVYRRMLVAALKAYRLKWFRAHPLDAPQHAPVETPPPVPTPAAEKSLEEGVITMYRGYRDYHLERAANGCARGTDTHREQLQWAQYYELRMNQEIRNRPVPVVRSEEDARSDKKKWTEAMCGASMGGGSVQLEADIRELQALIAENTNSMMKLPPGSEALDQTLAYANRLQVQLDALISQRTPAPQSLREKMKANHEVRKQEDERYLGGPRADDPPYRYTPRERAYAEREAAQAKYRMEMYANPDPHTRNADTMFKLSDQLMTTYDHVYVEHKSLRRDASIKKLAEQMFGQRMVVGVDLASELSAFREDINVNGATSGRLDSKSPSFGSFFPGPKFAKDSVQITTCHVCNKEHEGTFAHYYPCGHAIEVQTDFYPAEGPVREDFWMASSQGTAAEHPLKEGAIAELRKKLGA